jgi:hypothetical protein
LACELYVKQHKLKFSVALAAVSSENREFSSGETSQVAAQSGAAWSSFPRALRGASDEGDWVRAPSVSVVLARTNKN